MITQNKIPKTIAQLEAFRHECLREAAYYLLGKMKNTITNQTESWAPLSLVTLRKKYPETRKLIHKGELLDSLKVKLLPLKATVGVHMEEPRWEIGVINEFGAPRAGIPSRSFIRSTWAKHKREVIAIVEGRFVKSMKVGK